LREPETGPILFIPIGNPVEQSSWQNAKVNT